MRERGVIVSASAGRSHARGQLSSLPAVGLLALISEHCWQCDSKKIVSKVNN
jgi:hypothetical protein